MTTAILRLRFQIKSSTTPKKTNQARKPSQQSYKTQNQRVRELITAVRLLQEKQYRQLPQKMHLDQIPLQEAPLLAAPLLAQNEIANIEFLPGNERKRWSERRAVSPHYHQVIETLGLIYRL